MSKFHVKKGEEVVVLAGKEKGKRGKIIAVSPKKQRVIVEGLQMIKRHTRKSQHRGNFQQNSALYFSACWYFDNIPRKVTGGVISFGSFFCAPKGARFLVWITIIRLIRLYRGFLKCNPYMTPITNCSECC